MLVIRCHLSDLRVGLLSPDISRHVVDVLIEADVLCIVHIDDQLSVIVHALQLEPMQNIVFIIRGLALSNRA